MMDTNSALESAKTLLAPWMERVETPEPERVDVYLAAEKIVEAVQAMVDAGGWHLSAMTGLDIPDTASSEGAIEILYQFCQGAAVVTLRIQVPYGLPRAGDGRSVYEVPSSLLPPLAPGEWRQVNDANLLRAAGFADATAMVSRLDGTAPFGAYAV